MNPSVLLRLLEETDDYDHDHDQQGEHLEGDDSSLPWGDVLIACFLVQLVTLSGIALASLTSVSGGFEQLYQHMIPSFASGALLATTVFLIVPESIALLQSGDGHTDHADTELLADEDNLDEDYDDHEGHDHRFLQEDEHEHGNAMWKFGAAVLAGFLIPILFGALFPQPDTNSCDECEVIREVEEHQRTMEEIREEQGGGDEADSSGKVDRETVDLNCEDGTCSKHEHASSDDDKATEIKPSTQKKTPLLHSRNWPLACSILVGDAFHNFCDGIFLANAFMLCDSSLGYTMVASTIYHELAQEIADYALLVHHCGLSLPLALGLNFLSGFSVWGGAILVMALHLSDEGTGLLLGISGGVYLFIAACECIPRINRQGARETLLFLECFLVGAVPIGLVLLNHGHCEPEEDHDH